MFSYPNFLGLHFRTGGALIKENDVCFDTWPVKNTSRQTENGVQIGCFQQLSAHNLASSALKQHIVWHNHGCLAGSFQNRVDVLHKIQLLVGTGRPEILTVINEVFFLLFALFIGKGEGGLFTKRRVCQNIIHTVVGVSQKGIAKRNRYSAVNVTNIVQIQVHQDRLISSRNNLIPKESFAFQKLFLFPVKRIIFAVGNKLLCGEEEAARTTAGVYKNAVFDTNRKAFSGT